MNRRNFFCTMVGGVAAAAAVRTWPFRVYSFPSEVVTPNWDQIVAVTLADIREHVLYDTFFVDTPFMKYLKKDLSARTMNPMMHTRLYNVEVPDGT